MAQTFTDYWNELKGEIPAIPPFVAQRCVQRSWDDILHGRRWSFLIAEGYLYAPALIDTGAVALTQFQTTATFNAAAMAALAAAVLPGSGVDITDRQFRVPSGPIYNITAYDPVTGIVTFDRKYMEATNAAALYEVYRCYYKPPYYTGTTIDFLRWISVFDPITGYKIRGKNLAFSRAELDRRDPMRTSYDNPIYVVPHHVGTDGTPYFELWPHPRTERTYTAPYQRRGLDLAAADTLPAAIHPSLLMNGARINAYDWASANQGRFEELRGVNWLQLKLTVQKQFDTELRRLCVQDEEAFLQTWSQFDGELNSFPIDAAWLQQHDPTGAWGS